MLRNTPGEQVHLLPRQARPWLRSRGIVFDRSALPARAEFYRDTDSPDEALDLLWREPSTVAELCNTRQVRVVRSGEFVLKTMRDQFDTRPERWELVAGLAALAINLALQEGLDEGSTLSNGYKVVAPTYYGALFLPGRQVSKWVMSYEQGVAIDTDNEILASDRTDRSRIYNAALRRVGINPMAAYYDDGYQNLLLRPDRKELVKLDALSLHDHATIMSSKEW